MKEVERRFRERLQPFFEQDMQVIAELENQMMRRLNEANVRAMQPLDPALHWCDWRKPCSICKRA